MSLTEECCMCQGYGVTWTWDDELEDERQDVCDECGGTGTLEALADSEEP